MEFLSRKLFALWIICVMILFIKSGCGLEGIPTWICLGIKSPFIEFRNEVEILSNISVSMNLTLNENGQHKNGLENLGSFIHPITTTTTTTTTTPSPTITTTTDNSIKFVSSSSISYSTAIFYGNNHNKNQPKKDVGSVVRLYKTEATTPSTTTTTTAGTNNEYDHEVRIIEESSPSDSSIFDKWPEDVRDRKYIIPLALKNPDGPRRNPIFQDSSTNVEDLKRHIVMLQNMTKNDRNFKSKFVVFPSLHRNNSIGTSSAAATSTTTTTMEPVQMPFQTNRDILRDTDEDNYFGRPEKVTIIPQVFLHQNDQTPLTADDGNDGNEAIINGQNNSVRIGIRRKVTRRPKVTKGPTRRNDESEARQSPQKNGNKRRRKQQNKLCKEMDDKLIGNCSLATSIWKETDGGGGGSGSSKIMRRNKTAGGPLQSINRSRNRNYSTSVNSPKRIKVAEVRTSPSSNEKEKEKDEEKEEETLNGNKTKMKRAVRSQRSGTKIAQNIPKEIIVPISSVNNNTVNQTNVYIENINLNPDLCYQVGGLSYGQQKLCVLHTTIMPAISRGARSAIQECKHQFKNRRWNCSTVNDDTVFGPITSIGSPEMAFIHALTAAGVASFIARACRDGQLASCGCSRSTRPKQLHRDWKWGGCGDDLEFGYKFSQSFIDIREKEKKRGPRGLVSIPRKYPKLDDKLMPSENGSLNDTAEEDNAHHEASMSPLFKPEDLLELQEKITKEILSSKLQEKEMHELQAKINREILNSKVFNLEHHAVYGNSKKTHQRTGGPLSRMKNSGSAKARSLMNLHNNEVGRRMVIKKSRVTCKCHGVSGSCSLITCWQQLTPMREIGDILREKYDEATRVKLNKRGRLQVHDPRYKVPTALDLVYLDESPDWCRNNKHLQWPGIHGRVCNKSSSGLDGCAILCCGRGYNTKKIVVKERCNCKFHWCCQVKCDVCVKTIEEYTCK